MGFVAAGVNVWCLRLLGRLGRMDVNLRAAYTFSVNDFISNIGVMVAAALVAWTDRFWQDVLVGAAIAVVVGKGGIDILRHARRSASANRGARP